MNQYRVFMRTMGAQEEFTLTIWANNEAHAISKAKELSQGCQVSGCAEVKETSRV